MTIPDTEVRVCQCCPNRLRPDTEDGRQVCRRCQVRLASELAEVATLWAQLPALVVKGTPAADTADMPRGPGPVWSQAPGNLEVLNLLGGGVSGPLLAEEDAWRRELRKTQHFPLTPRRGTQDATVRGCVAWLQSHLYWACVAYPDVDDLDRTLGKLLGAMRGLTSGDQRRREDLEPSCPMPARGHDEDDPTAPACGGTLAYDPRRKVIRCDTCRRAFGAAQFDVLGAAAGLITLPFTAPAA